MVVAAGPLRVDGQRISTTEKGMAKRRAITTRALADIDRWLAAPAAEAAE